MMYLILAPVMAFGMLYFTWLLYQAVMNLQRARDNGTLPRPAYYLGLPILAVGLFWDCLMNVTVVNFIFWELPKELLITSRLERHAFGADGWRKNLAKWFAANLLDPFDPRGTHVRE
ncbi:MAG TPA: hypothetical protein VM783_14095 [Candidatus Acidoferrum sp.]|nr:hypothetical protein [Candidatus Acidoferrum sp.]